MILILCTQEIPLHYNVELVFGFEPTEYNVNEGAESVSLGITFSSGNAGEFVPNVILSTQDGTAISKQQHTISMSQIIISL